MRRFASSADLHAAMLHRAALLGLRGMGNVEPNPMVGCVIGRALSDGSAARVESLGVGHHRAVGERHAEIDALESCRRQGHDPRGATMWVTLEPCAHHGRTPPCAQAIIDAGVARVVYAACDKGEGAGGADALRAAGVDAIHSPHAPLAAALSAPHRKRVADGLPWVICKWAQTLDGRIADRAGASQWISGPPARRRVHRLRARVDAIMVGVGTILADDPTLTARDARRVRRVARRVLVDPRLRSPTDSRLASAVESAPITLLCAAEAGATDRADAWRSLGAEVLALPRDPAGGLPLSEALRHLVKAHDVATILVEGGARLFGALFDADLVDEAIVFIAPKALGDAAAAPAIAGAAPRLLDAAQRFELCRMRSVGGDAMLHWRRAP